MKIPDHLVGGFMLAGAMLSTGALAQGTVDKQAIRSDAFLLMGAGLSVPGVAAYCNKYVESNSELLEAAREWNARHREVLEKTVRAVEWSGGLSTADREKLDRLAFQLVKREIDAERDKPGHCREVAAAVRDGRLDLDKRPDTAPAARRILGAIFYR